MKTEYQRKKEAHRRAEMALKRTKAKLGVRPAGELRGAVPSPLVAETLQRKVKVPPTSDRVPGPAPASNLIHDYKWKRDAGESQATVNEIRRKASQIAPAYNKGALQYLPDDKD
jgi:hypothetical protein